MREQFDEFRKHYPGIKRGNETEFDNFVKHHKDWKAVLPTLLIAIKAQIAYKEQMVRDKQWTPGWPHLRTWMNQRRWEEEMPEIRQATPQAKAKGLIPFTTCHKCGAGADVRVGDHSTPYCRGCRPEAFKTQFPGIDL